MVKKLLVYFLLFSTMQNVFPSNEALTETAQKLVYLTQKVDAYKKLQDEPQLDCEKLYQAGMGTRELTEAEQKIFSAHWKKLVQTICDILDGITYFDTITSIDSFEITVPAPHLPWGRMYKESINVKSIMHLLQDEKFNGTWKSIAIVKDVDDKSIEALETVKNRLVQMLGQVDWTVHFIHH